MNNQKYKVNSLSRKQSKSYTVLALRNLFLSKKTISGNIKVKIIKDIVEEIDVMMKIYTANEATNIADKIIKLI